MELYLLFQMLFLNLLFLQKVIQPFFFLKEFKLFIEQITYIPCEYILQFSVILLWYLEYCYKWNFYTLSFLTNLEFVIISYLGKIDLLENKTLWQSKKTIPLSKAALWKTRILANLAYIELYSTNLTNFNNMELDFSDY